MTFSIAARCLKSHSFGLAIASSSPAVAARCVHARSGVGAVATQNITDPALGPRILDLLSQDPDAARALRSALAATPFAEYRQLLVVAPSGAPQVHSGRHALGIAGSAIAAHCAAAGNLLAHPAVPGDMAEAFETANGPLADRLLLALQAGLARGGEAGAIHSAGLLVVREVTWPIVDLRVDWSDAPLSALASLWQLYSPQVEDYVQRAVNPLAAPAYGVPGE